MFTSPGDSEDKESACSTGDPDLIPGSGKFPGEGNGNPLQYSCLENPMDRGTLQAVVHRVKKSWTLLKQLSIHVHSGEDLSPMMKHRTKGFRPKGWDS